MLGGRRSRGFSAKIENLGGSRPCVRRFERTLPFTVMDLILTLAEDQLFEFVWSKSCSTSGSA